MSRKVIFLIFFVSFLFVLVLGSVFSFFIYSKKVASSVELKYFPPSKIQEGYGRIDFYFEYPVSKDYFLKNTSFSPKIEGDFVFEREAVYFSKIRGYKKISFFPEEIERDKPYKIKTFEKEFTFSLPSPKVKKVLYDQKEKRLEIEFFEPIEEDYFLKTFQLDPKPKGRYVFLEENKKVVFIPEEKEEDVEYKGEILDKEISFKVEVPKVKDIYFDKNKKEVVAIITEPVKEEKIFNTLQVNPPLKYTVSFEDQNTKVVIKLEDIKEDTNYNLKLLKKEFNFVLPSLKVTNIYFDKNKKQVVVVFNTQIEEDRFLKEFKIEPQVEGKFIFSPNKDWVVFQPYQLEEEKLYKVTILGASLSFKIYKVTPPPPPPPSSQDKYIDIDLSSQTLRLYQDGKVIATYLISSGRPGMETPTGTFRVLSKYRLLWSSQYGLYMPYSLQFYNGYYIHELPYWPGGYREGENHLGIPVSHGCVRLGVGAAEVVYNFADIGTKVVIHK